MAIGKGQDWGSAGYLPDDAPIATGDAAAAAMIGHHAVIGLAGGDLARTLGITTPHGGVPYDRDDPRHLVPIDGLQIDLDDGSSHLCIAHAIIGNLGMHGHSAAVMNAAFVDRLNLAPRAHPGDGKADLVTLRLRPAERFKAWKRMRTGTHVPHPAITISRTSAGTVELSKRRAVRIDGRMCGRSRTLGFQVIPEAIVVAVA